MFRKVSRLLLPNRLDWILKRCAKKGGKKILLAWNRGLGDIALGLYAMVLRIRDLIPDAEITFLIRENLRDGFTMLEDVKTVIAPGWKRGVEPNIGETLQQLGMERGQFDLVLEKPNPTDWLRWQLGKVVPRLKWDSAHDDLWKKFNLPDGFSYVAVQTTAETNYGLWRNWPEERWEELFERLPKSYRVILFGFDTQKHFSQPNVIDLRGKTTLFELLSIIKNCCHSLILPDSGILSMVYYLDTSFPIQVLSLWADPNHGILKQAVRSPNSQLTHIPLIGEKRNLSKVTVNQVLSYLNPVKPLTSCKPIEEIKINPIEKCACVILAGGQGTRLGAPGPKGLFSVGGKSLFQWICEKVPDKKNPLAIMTSPLNHEETVAFFEKHSCFGLEIHFFQQEMTHYLNDKKEAMDVKGPNGNGSVFRSFVKAGLADLFEKRGIDVLTVIPVENPLANPFDGSLISHLRDEKADVVMKCVKRLYIDQSMGALVERNGKIQVLEYTELDPTQTYQYSNVGQMAFDLSFFKKMGEVELPLHWVKKEVPIGANKAWVWKGEQFIFDALPHANKVRALCAPRETCYAPLKTRESIEAVQKMMVR